MNSIAIISQNSKSEIVGRIGGNIPYYLLEKIEIIKEYNFYITFQNPDNLEEYISVLVPKNYDTMIDNNVYPNCSVKVFSHTFSEESDNVGYTINYIKNTPIVGYNKVGSDEFNFITKSDKPNLIQEEDYYSEALEKDGYVFFMQIDEDYYPENLIDGNYIFGYGALYLYKREKTGEIVAGFWQYS